MARSHFHPSSCKSCGQSNKDGTISQQGLCSNCGLERRLLNIAQLEHREGPYYDHWERRCLMWARRLLVAREARLDNAGQEG